jgi:APA family basic amino acid/polyamine antiporter
MFFSYLGFEQIANFAEEMRRPQRDLPRAMSLAIAGSTAIYVLVAVSVVAAVDWRELGASDAPLALVARTTLGARADLALTLIALAATANTVLLVIVSVSRSVYGMAAAGVLPGGLAVVGQRGTPILATALVVGVTAVLVLPGDLARVAAMTDASMLLSFILVNLSLPTLAARGLFGNEGRLRVTDVVVPAMAMLLCVWLLLHTGWIGAAATLGLVAVGLVARFGVSRMSLGSGTTSAARP